MQKLFDSVVFSLQLTKRQFAKAVFKYKDVSSFCENREKDAQFSMLNLCFNIIHTKSNIHLHQNISKITMQDRHDTGEIAKGPNTKMVFLYRNLSYTQMNLTTNQNETKTHN